MGKLAYGKGGSITVGGSRDLRLVSLEGLRLLPMVVRESAGTRTLTIGPGVMPLCTSSLVSCDPPNEPPIRQG